MKVAVFGCGYVGLVSACGFVEIGHSVVCVDVDRKRVDSINSKKAYLTEAGLAESLQKNVPSRIRATLDAKQAVLESDAVFVCVGTPTFDDGTQDSTALEASLKAIGSALKGAGGFKVIVIKSTVLPGTTEGLAKKVLESSSGKPAGKGFGLADNPEFLQEGNALQDVLKPSRIVLGVTDAKTEKILKELYSPIKAPVLVCSPTEAELSKYASNAFLTVKVSYANELALLCRKLGVRAKAVTAVMGADPRIGTSFLSAGLGWGGSCFPKDTSALRKAYQNVGLTAGILGEAVRLNYDLVGFLLDDVERKAGALKGKKVAVLGVTFKPQTDDTRDSASLRLMAALKGREASIVYADPEVKVSVAGARQLEPQEAVDSADVVVIATAWPQFASLKFGEKLVFDARGLLAQKPPKNYVNWS